MLKEVSEGPFDKKISRTILLNFTRELIRQSGEGMFSLSSMTHNQNLEHSIDELEEMIKSSKEIYEEHKEKKESKGEVLKSLKEIHVAARPQMKPTKKVEKKPQYPRFNIPVLRVPHERLPNQFNYLKPSHPSKQVELGNLSSIINNSNVFEIEVHGPGEDVFVIGPAGKQQTGIALSKEEIETIIDNFSQSSKIPVTEGHYKVAVGNLILNAIVSFEHGSKILIKKANTN